jgi:hypothetical protein
VLSCPVVRYPTEKKMQNTYTATFSTLFNCLDRQPTLAPEMAPATSITGIFIHIAKAVI